MREAIASSAEPRARKRGGLWWLGGLLWLLALLGLAGLSLAGYWGREDWRLDAVSHFRLQYFAAALLLVLLLLWRRRWWLFILATLLCLYNTASILNWPKNPGLWQEPALKAVSINVYTRNQDIDSTVALLRQERPDFVSLTEITGAWRPAIENLKDIFPYQDVRIYGRNFGSAILSSHPFTDRDLPKLFGYPGTGSQAREVETPLGKLILLLVHPLSPMNEKAWGWRNRTLGDIAEFVRKADQPVLLYGDLNCTPWSPFFKDFVEQSGLHQPDTRVLPRRTWKSGHPWFWIQIDHFLLSPELTALTEWVGPDVGSDHYPILLIFAFKAEN